MNWKVAVEQKISIDSIRQAMEVAGRGILPVVSKRVFTEGKATDGSLIGQYSTKPIYISKKNSPRNAGEDKGKTLFFPGGYREFKEKIGRGEKVNLKLFGRLQTDYLTPKKVDIPNGVRYELKETANIEKKAYAESHFGKDIFGLTESELKTVLRTIKFQISR